MTRTLWMLASCVLLGAGVHAQPRTARHVRVVLDVSGSMKTNDPGGLAKLATLLLHDLARPSAAYGDTFEVLPFDQAWRWASPNDPPPRSTRARLSARAGRAALSRALDALAYDASNTYFYPGLLAAAEDLLPRPADAVRAIVLLTDGLPLERTRDAERELIRSQVVKLLEANRIELYVLAFGKEVAGHKAFFDEMVTGPSGSLGAVYVDESGDQLPANMLKIFARAFGYVPDEAARLPGVATLDLRGRQDVEDVAIVIFSRRSREAPVWSLRAPAGGSVRPGGDMLAARQTGGSYALRWILRPDEGRYAFDTNVLDGSVALLRPVWLDLVVLPATAAPGAATGRAGGQIASAMARSPFPLRVLARTPATLLGDPGPIELSFRAAGPRTSSRAGGERYEWVDTWKAVPGKGQPAAEGRVFDVAPQWPREPEPEASSYQGHLELVARRGGAVVGSRSGDFAHPVEIYPRLALTPSPPSGHAAGAGLKRGEAGCATFALTVTGPLPRKERLGLRAVLDARDPAALAREFRAATFTLDGKLVELQGQPQAVPADWSGGVALTPQELQSEHRLCVTIGKPTDADPAHPPDVELRFTLQETPYDALGVVAPYTLRVPVVPPTFLERWRVHLIATLLVLGLFATLWYGRDRPYLPPDLAYSLGREEGDPPPARPFGDVPLGARVFAVTARSPLRPAGEDQVVAWLSPARQELYQLKLRSGWTVDRIHPADPLSVKGRMATIAVHRFYLLKGPQGSFRLRLEYR